MMRRDAWIPESSREKVRVTSLGTALRRYQQEGASPRTARFGFIASVTEVRDHGPAECEYVGQFEHVRASYRYNK